MLTEKQNSFRRCYVNGKKCAVLSLSDGRAILLNSQNDFADEALTSELRGAGLSLRSFHNAYPLASADAAGIMAIISGAVIDWEGSKEYNARIAAAAGSRSGGAGSASSSTASTSTTSGGGSATAGAVASSDAFQVPGVESVSALADVLRLLPANVGDDVKAWGVAVGASVLEGSECPAVPESCSPFLVMPSFPPALDCYRMTIQAAAKEYAAKMAEKIEKERAAAKEYAAKMAEKIEKERAAAERAEAERLAAEKGCTCVTLSSGRVLEVPGLMHKDFKKVAELIDRKLNVYLHGPAGTGKTTLAKQIAAAFGVDLYRNGKVEDIFNAYCGVNMPGSGFAPTPYYLAFTRGALYFQDEIDLSYPSAVNWLQTSIDERQAIFNDGTGEMTHAHENFICIAAANTPGYGPTTEYPESMPMSPAFRRRFVSVFIDYDPEIDKKAAGGDAVLLDFVKQCRAALKKCGLPLTCSPEEIKRIKALDGIFSDNEIIDMIITKGLPGAQLREASYLMDKKNRWAAAFIEIADKAA